MMTAGRTNSQKQKTKTPNKVVSAICNLFFIIFFFLIHQKSPSTELLVIPLQPSLSVPASRGLCRQMTRELLHIRNHNGFCTLPRSTTDTTTERNMHAGDASLEWAQMQFITFYYIETRPKETHLLVDSGTDISHHGNGIVLAGYECFNLLFQQFIFLFFFHNKVL